MLENILLQVVEMSITASIVATIIMVFRWMLGNKLPKSFSYAVWLIVLIRLLVPVTISSNLSIFNIVPSPKTTIKATISESAYMDKNSYKSEIYNLSNNKSTSKANNEISNNLKETVYLNNNSSTTKDNSPSIKLKQNYVSIIAYLWLSVVLVMLGISIFAYIKTLRRLNMATLYKDNNLVEECKRRLNFHKKIDIYTSEVIDTPVVVGLTKARIILPISFAYKYSQEELKLMVTHELVHIKRRDHIIKLLSVLALCIHWFNPFVWISFILSQRDMEMSCDEKVLSTYNKDMRSQYAKSLIDIATRQNVLFNGGVLAFGESNIKSRIKRIMKFKKTKLWIGVTSGIVLLVFGFVLLTNGQNTGIGNNSGQVALGSKSQRTYIDQKLLDDLLKHRSQYIGDASNVSNLLNKLPYGDRKDGISLETESQPYGITINYKLEDIDNIQDNLKNIKPALINNSLILFSLIENVETVNFNLISKDNLQLQFTRAEMQKYFDKDLWGYSVDKKSFEEFMLNISFQILVYPEEYSLAMSSVPGMQLGVSVNGEYYNNFSTRYSAQNGFIRTMKDGKVSEPSKTIEVDGGFVYWVPYDMSSTDKEDTVTISILDKEGNVIIEKKIKIKKEENKYIVIPSFDIITDDIYK